MNPLLTERKSPRKIAWDHRDDRPYQRAKYTPDLLRSFTKTRHASNLSTVWQACSIILLIEQENNSKHIEEKVNESLN